MRTLERPRLYLIVPPGAARGPSPGAVEAALAAGDVAAVLITGVEAGGTVPAGVAQVIAAAQRSGAAALVEGPCALAARLGADGAHLTLPVEDLAGAIGSRQEERIVGVGGPRSRHEAMLAAEAGADYVLFGRLGAEPRPSPHPRALEEAAWWAETFEIPAVVLGGTSLDFLPQLIDTRAEFVALREAVWNHPDGPDAAVAAVNAALDRVGAPA